MKLDILLSCMYQNDDTIIRNSRITGDAVVINQCDREEYAEYDTEFGKARFFCTTERGLTKSRNMAVRQSDADICLLCDDDELFVDDYEKKILQAYVDLPQADLIAFKVTDVRSPRTGLPDQVTRLHFPKTMKISSWQISFRRERLLSSQIRFDELLGAGTGNGAEEEMKFLCDCEKAGLVVFYVPIEIASITQDSSTWFAGYTEDYFENRGATTRYILGRGIASLYAVYYVVRKRKLYQTDISPWKALKATMRGIRKDKITKQSNRES